MLADLRAEINCMQVKKVFAKVFPRPRNNTISLLLYFRQNYLVITECEGYCIANTTRHITLRPSLVLNLSCGNNYTFTVKIQSTRGTGPGSNISVSMKPPTGAVTNLTIRFIAGNSRMEDAFLLRWNLPKQRNTTSIEVGRLRALIPFTRSQLFKRWIALSTR